MSSAFERAAGRLGATEISLELAGLPVLVRAAGDRLAELLRTAFATVSVADRMPGRPELEISIWDEAAAGIAWQSSAGPGWSESSVGFGTTVRISPSGAENEIGQGIWRSALSRPEGSLVCSIVSAEGLNNVHRGRPLKLPLSIWLRDRGRMTMHGALVSRRGRGVLLVGDEGAGKTTVALDCLEAGWDYVADDHVPVRLEDGLATGEGLYAFVGLTEEQIASRPDLACAAIPPPPGVPDKTLVSVASVPGYGCVRVAPIDAVVIPQVREGFRAELQPGTAAQALAVSAHTSLLMQPLSPGAQGMATLKALYAAVPVHRVAVGYDGAGAAELLDSVLGGKP